MYTSDNIKQIYDVALDRKQHRGMWAEYTSAPQSKTHYLHFRSHAEYFRLSLENSWSD